MLERDGSGNTSIATCSTTINLNDVGPARACSASGSISGCAAATLSGEESESGDASAAVAAGGIDVNVQGPKTGTAPNHTLGVSSLDNSEIKGVSAESEDAKSVLESRHTTQRAVNPLQLHLRHIPGRGNGVFTSASIPAGSLIEESPVLLMTAEQWEKGKMQETVLGEYGFCWSGGGQAIGLGLASLFNHSSRPNVNFIRQTATSTIRFIAARRIEPGEELCICYSADESKLWFTPTPNGEGVDQSSPLPTSPLHPPNNFPDLEGHDLLDAEEIVERDERIRKRLERKEAIRQAERSKAKIREPRLEGSRPSSRSDSVSSSIATSNSSYPTYPTLPDSQPLDLPPPLHSGPSRATSSIPAVLCPELDWREEEWARGKREPEKVIPGWVEVLRVKGPAELEEEAEERGTIDIWVVSVQDPKLTRLVLDFSKDQCPADPRMRHLKRVARRPHPDTGEDTTLIALCAMYNSDLIDLQTALSTYHPSLLDVVPFRRAVPASSAKSADELKLKSPLWPVSYAPGSLRISDSSAWPITRKAWALAGIRRIIAVAREAKAAGELPVGTFVISPPECLWPAGDAFIPPTPFLRASASDTRRSTSHPLKHAALNCIRQIATLRTQPPFSEMQPTRNGADYLLTSLTLFITHEPCVMCCMALLHSRVREVFYIFPRKNGGGFESAFGVHGRKDLNHRFEVWRYIGPEGEVDSWQDELAVDDNLAL